MSRKALTDDFTLQDCQGREECCRPMEDIVMSEGSAPPLLERQTRLSAIQGLNLALLINTEDQALCWRIEVKANHVRQFLQELDIPRKLEASGLMGLEIVVLP